MRALIAALAVLAVAAPAARADTTYGGTGVYKGRSAAPWVSLVRHDDGRISGRATVIFHCHGFRSYGTVVRLAGRSSGAAFTASGSTRLVAPLRRLRTTLTGTLTADAGAATIKARIPHCRVRTFPVTLRSASAPAGPPAMPTPGSLLIGLSSQAAQGVPLTVAIRVARNGRIYADWQAILHCRSGGFPMTDATPVMTVKPDGTFTESQTYTLRFRGAPAERYRVRFSGRFLADGAVGTMRATMTWHKPGVRYYPCPSGVQSWAAR